MRIQLTKPLLLAGERVAALELREDVTAGDIWDFVLPFGADGRFSGPPPMGDVLKVAARLADLPEDAMRRLSAGDAREVYVRTLPLCLGSLAAGSAASGNSSSTVGSPSAT